MRRAVLGVGGSVAAYRAADLARDLMRAGFEVRACLTDSAQNFVSAALFEALTGQPCLIDTFEEPERGRMAHIDWARAADLVLVAPATANLVNKLAAGIADDMLSTLALAYRGPMAIAPAMNPSMFAHPTTMTSIQALRERGVWVVEPAEGDVACGENGQGKLATNARIIEEAVALTVKSERLKGQTVVITSGPTQEPIDDVRFLSNRSSGKMGMALCRAALSMGARVIVISGPVQGIYPPPAEVIGVRTAVQMGEALMSVLPQADWVIGAAAVADYRPANPVKGKIRRSSDALNLELTPNEDLIAKAAAATTKAKVIGFAAEPSPDLAIAQEKLKRKGLFAIAANDVSDPSIGFESGENALSLVFADGRVLASGKRSKLACATWLFESLLS